MTIAARRYIDPGFVPVRTGSRKDSVMDALARLVAEDCAFDDTTPPDGVRHAGRDEVQGAWGQFLAESPTASFEIEDVFTTGDRAVVRWRYAWADGHIRCVDLFRARAGQVTESLAYMKG